MKKTALQELISKLEKQLSTATISNHYDVIKWAIDDCKELLEKERHDLMNAFKTGTLYDQEMYFYMSPEEFYDKNYEPIN